jgi:hypothetical protein
MRPATGRESGKKRGHLHIPALCELQKFSGVCSTVPYFDSRKAREKVSRTPEITDQEPTILTNLRQGMLIAALSTLCASRIHVRLENLEVELGV